MLEGLYFYNFKLFEILDWKIIFNVGNRGWSKTVSGMPKLEIIKNFLCYFVNSVKVFNNMPFDAYKRKIRTISEKETVPLFSFFFPSTTKRILKRPKSAFERHKSHNSKWDLQSLRYYSSTILTYRKALSGFSSASLVFEEKRYSKLIGKIESAFRFAISTKNLFQWNCGFMEAILQFIEPFWIAITEGLYSEWWSLLSLNKMRCLHFKESPFG